MMQGRREKQKSRITFPSLGQLIRKRKLPFMEIEKIVEA